MTMFFYFMERCGHLNKIRVLYGSQPDKMAVQMMEAMGVAEEIKALNVDAPLIGLKPNLVVAQPSHWGATTSPELVAGVIRYLKDHGMHRIVIMESSWVGDCTAEAFKICGYEALSQEFDVLLIDLKKDSFEEVVIDGYKLNVCGQPLKADYLINLPVLKAHCQMKITCALKNMKGCIPDMEKRRFHRLGLHEPIAYLNKALRSHLTIVDGIIGDLTHEEGGNPVRMGRVIAGRDPVLVDTYVTELLGYGVGEIPYIEMAAGLGVGSCELRDEDVIELNQAAANLVEEIEPGLEVDQLRPWFREIEACSPCVGGLIHALRRLKEQGKLEALPQNIVIGQGFKNRQGRGIGIGACTGGYPDALIKCPPTAKEIVTYLEKYLVEER